ncbi:uncharacterized protein [Procambarus clarkii]|uniref:uncharacterized protein isoform X1 n=1 Tax=Procambarus clarkii TaxID=6728 RepID=UPI0037441E4D
MHHTRATFTLQGPCEKATRGRPDHPRTTRGRPDHPRATRGRPDHPRTTRGRPDHPRTTRGRPDHPRTTRQQSLSWCPSRARRLQPNLSATRGRQNDKPLRQALPLPDLKSSMEPVCSLPKTSTSRSPPPGCPSVVPPSSPGSTSSSVSSLESLTSPRAPLNASVLDLHRPVSISPPTTLSSIEPCNPPFDPAKGYVGVMPQPRLEGSDGMPQESLARVSKPDGEIGISMDELADIGKWVADTREELKGVGKLLGQPQSRLSSILQGLSAGTFDEDKYIISRRVDQYIDKILRNNVDEEGRCTPSGAPPVIHRPAGPETRPAGPEVRPAGPETRPAGPEARPDTAAAPSGLVNDPELAKPRNRPRTLLPTHPPPLFVHSLMGRGRSDPLEPLQNYGIEGESAQYIYQS